MTGPNTHIQTASGALNLVREMVLAVDDTAGVERIEDALAYFDTFSAHLDTIRAALDESMTVQGGMKNDEFEEWQAECEAALEWLDTLDTDAPPSE